VVGSGVWMHICSHTPEPTATIYFNWLF